MTEFTIRGNRKLNLIKCFLGFHKWNYEFVIVGTDILQKRKCSICGQNECRSIYDNMITGWYE